MGDNTEIEWIHKWNEMVGNKQAKRSLDDDSVRMYYNLIREEFNELVDAYIAGDRKEVVDALADMQVVTTGMAHMMGYNMEDILFIVNESNFSKFVDSYSADEVQQSIEQYENDSRYKDVHLVGNVLWGTVVETGSKKVLKGIAYHPPKWENLDGDLV